MSKRLSLLSAVAAVSAVFCACSGERPVLPDPVLDKVMILYSCGYNNLSSMLQEDIEDIGKSRTPNIGERNRKRVLIYSHQTGKSGDYSTPTHPVLFEMSRDLYGKLKRDTLAIFPDTTNSASAYTLNKVLTYIKDHCPSREYGLVFSSHATGWLQKGGNIPETSPIDWSDNAVFTAGNTSSYGGDALSSYTHYNPLSKTIGAQFIGSSSRDTEIEACDFVNAIPMHLKYIAMDACLAGGIEIAYELRGKTDYYISSQSEIEVDGFPYDVMTNYLVFSEVTDVRGLAEAYYLHYAPDRWATISTIDCNKLQNLTAVCKTLFEKYKDQLYSTSSQATRAQRYDGVLDWPYFYDLEDIFLKIGIEESEKTALNAALSEAVVYKAATKISFHREIKHHCGLSMYLPSKGTEQHRAAYRKYQWNKDTGLVK